MTPEETKAMADRIAKNRQEENLKAVANKPKEEKVVKIKKEKAVKAAPKAKAKKALRAKRVVGPATAKFKFKAERKRGECDVLGCNAKPQAGFRCTKHRKLIRKAQLKANNVVWKKRVKAGTAGHHVVYTRPGEKLPIATRFAMKAPEKALEVVRKEHSIVEEVGVMKEILARTKASRKVKAAKKKAA